MNHRTEPIVRRVLGRLRRDGVLLFTDTSLPSVVSLVVGEPVAGSWWAHPAGPLVYAVGSTLEEHPDVVSVPLLRRKATLVHRRLWPDLWDVATSRSEWQAAKLPTAASALLRLVEARGELRLDTAPPIPLPPRKTLGETARVLERRLLAHGRSIHTESGRHVKVLESWDHWAGSRRFQTGRTGEQIGRRHLEEAASRAYPATPLDTLFPWLRGGRAKSKGARKRR